MMRGFNLEGVSNMKWLLIAASSGLLWLVFSSLNAKELDVSQFRSQCEDITQQERELAKSAGYDIDALCDSLKVKLAADKKQVESLPTILPRDSEISTNERGVISGANIVTDALSQLKEKDEPSPSKEREFQDENGLPYYGYDLFAGVPTTFAPATDIPIPVNYVIGPGDTFHIQLLGKVNEKYELAVARDGVIHFPELGPILVAGLSYSGAKKLIEDKVAEQMIGGRAVVALGELRSIRVFVLGEAYKPGSYTVSALSTMTNALLVSGGVKRIGSLRNIQLKRQGRVVTRLDLYDLLQRGDTRNDVSLLPGDVIYIPPVGLTAGINGEVKRPAVYELKGNERLSDLVRLAGGYSAKSYPSLSSLSRQDKSGFSTVLDLDLTQKSAQSKRLVDGDRVEIGSVLSQYDRVVSLTGRFVRPRTVEWQQGLRLSGLIDSVKDFELDADLNLALVVRTSLPLREVSVLHVDLAGLLAGKREADIVLSPMDEVVVFDHNSERVELLEPLIKRLKQQTAQGGLMRLVEVGGHVRLPGVYPLSEAMTLRDLVLLAGGLKEASYLVHAEVTRSDLSNLSEAKVEHIKVNLAEQLMGKGNFRIQAKDKLSIFGTPEYREEQLVELRGEVRFPGKYSFRRGETLSQVVSRAGGLTSMAHVEAAVFTRESLRRQELKRLRELKERMRRDLASSQLEESNAGKGEIDLEEGEELLEALSETEALGRLVIDLEGVLSSKTADIQLKQNDSLVIPSLRQEVSVLGEVQHPTSHLYHTSWTLDDYLEKSGGLTNRADDDRLYVVRADGSVYLPNQSGWLTHGRDKLKPGDAIVVPVDTDRIKSLDLWSRVSTIVYQIALGYRVFRLD